MSAPVVINAAEWELFLDTLELLWLWTVVLALVMKADFWHMADRWRVHKRRRRIRAIRYPKVRRPPPSIFGGFFS